jgi:hypothetical protein
MSTPYRTTFLLSLAALAVVVLLQAAPALASCTYHTYTINGRMVTCSTCCYGSICNTNGF